ncbi:histidinol-phosphate transaminase [Methylococcus sp. EFPC2]|uniref:histidinol-phosphate transaminase n=1 Tax=Methylococcus sp. EFPC2 TaxID=2812648 RepID=UPI001966F72E|nr:histidinol-phosphate transaminase [Methylococcus sp. EFPC2]QSA98708.1 histidinol-phosphate transaminase [Methylococcus sp. EFPC2]
MAGSNLENRVEALIRPEILALKAYHVQASAGYVKLDAMENPYVWPTEMIEEWLGVLRSAKPNRYPDPAADGVRAALRIHGGVPDGAGLMLGNGSDELIQIILMAVAGRNAKVLAPEPTFVMYRQIAGSLGLSFVGVPLREEDFALDMDAMRAAIRDHAPAVVFLAYPNNPTGNAFAVDDVLEILRISPGLVVVDEAYAPFADDSFMSRLGNFDNLLVMRTLSKLGLAGLRLGYLAGHTAWIDQLDKLRLPYNINELTQLTVSFALSRQAVFDRQVADIRRDRASLASALRAVAGLRVYPSQANFITLRLLEHEAAHVFDGLKRRGVLVKNLHTPAGPLQNCLRVTVGLPEENARFLAALEDALIG